MKTQLLFSLSLAVTAFAQPAHAQNHILGLDTNGVTFEVVARTGAFTAKSELAFTSFSLGATARKGNVLYYVAIPGGGTDPALFAANSKTSAITVTDLDRNESVRALFFSGRSLYGVLYDALSNSAGVYRIDPATGITSLVVDLSGLDVEPIPGALAKVGKVYSMLVRPEVDSERRQLLTFRLRAGSAAVVEIADKDGIPVQCDKLKPNKAKKDFVCLASAADETQVNFCRLNSRGVARCVTTLPGIERVGSGHTLVTTDEANYFAFVYVPGEPDNQHLIRLNSRGAIKSNVALPTISIGGHFLTEAPTPLPHK